MAMEVSRSPAVLSATGNCLRPSAIMNSQADPASNELQTARSTSPPPSLSPLFTLPPELLSQILSYLSPRELATVCETCSYLHEHASNDIIWKHIVNHEISPPLHSPTPFDSFKSLYITHYPFWFIVRQKIWFSDIANTGKLLIARYNSRTGAIEAFRVVAKHPAPQKFEVWPHDPRVIIHSFDPDVTPYLDDPVVQLEKSASSDRGSVGDWRGREMRMPMASEAHRIFNNFMLCTKILSATLTNTSTNAPKLVWPPLRIPATERAEVHYPSTTSFVMPIDDKPMHVDKICQTAFRLKRWLQFGTLMTTFDPGTAMDGISTYGTLRAEDYTPTAEKPYRGIWVGDYSGHGPEFLLVIQRDNTASRATQQPPATAPDRSSQSYTGPRGRLEAIKLTGDPNVPRGEITWYANDIGPDGLIRVADEDIFKNARVVRSMGHIASTNFRNDRFIPSQLILVSPDCIAHFWTELKHISYYRRVDVEKLVRCEENEGGRVSPPY
ncbi:hypothetical protein AJ80_06159 [Polytolypa hystricis UAMH7299]|uniref:F-box domain-containing protein n=1 Tax=Polytolypa hystricis (strain UAMH7299) TaxID=1447883 RepID=A0A2B7XXY4_POLH7|nr:hypothetical protein AJ80_06159 [Polytolypa hystricis UAMH7299]